MPLPSLVVEPVDAARTVELRQRVLRPYLTVEEVAAYPEEGSDLQFYGAVDPATGEVLATGNVRREEPPAELAAEVPPLPAWRLRGMATREDLRDRGVGALVLDALVDHVAAHGGGVLWCSARVGARRLYARAGFGEFGDEYEVEHIGPHVLMWRTVQGA